MNTSNSNELTQLEIRLLAALEGLIAEVVSSGWSEAEVVVCLADLSEDKVLEVWQRAEKGNSL
jgi:hypothetical protein